MFRMTAAATLIAASAGTAFGATVYFGEDLHNSNTMPLPVGSRVNATAASNSFFAGLAMKGLTGVTTSFEESEGFTANPQFVPSPMPGDVGFNPLVSFADTNGTTAQITNGVVRFQAEGTAGPDIQPSGRYPTTGTQYLSAATDNLMLQFNRPQVAFSFWGVDIGDFQGNLSLTLADGSGEMIVPVNHTIGGAGDISGSVLFWGIIDCDNPFTSIRFSRTGGPTEGNDQFAFDDFTIGFQPETLIPLPNGLGLGVAGLAGMGAFSLTRRRRMA